LTHSTILEKLRAVESKGQKELCHTTLGKCAVEE